MEEKKLTDEEIINALDKTKQELANISPEDEDYDKLLTVKIIVDYCHDLIHRQKAEIERIKEVNAGLALANLCDLPPNEDCLTDNEFEAARKTIAEQKAEIERLTREVDKQKNFVTSWEESWKIANEQNTKIRVKLKKENAELQKQVDELTAFKNEAISMSLYGKGRKDGEAVAVKDTAKEIIRWIKLNGILEYGGYVIHDSTIEQMCKKFGVEVE